MAFLHSLPFAATRRPMILHGCGPGDLLLPTVQTQARQHNP
jgi:hypothetical protein